MKLSEICKNTKKFITLNQEELKLIEELKQEKIDHDKVEISGSALADFMKINKIKMFGRISIKRIDQNDTYSIRIPSLVSGVRG
jgi:glutaredoxin-related protein